MFGLKRNAGLKELEQHLKQENPVLLDVVHSFRKLDRVGHALGILERHESWAMQVPWWPLISVLGTFSSGKSTFINSLIGESLQSTGNQAVDDRFTVICYSSEKESRVLPGLALDADPRFPFYRISRSIEQVASGEGRRIDAYLQLKTCPCPNLKGKIIIDSPGFDADEQRNATLRVTNHIINLSDLVLVFFDARHPEPGAMHDTLEHLIAETIRRPDSSKFLYILNQIDTAAQEDNPEEVIAAWQRALAQKGLTAGRFFRIYDLDAAVPIEDEATRKRFRKKRDADMQEILARIQQVEVERAYRIISVLDQTAAGIAEHHVPRISRLLKRWRRRVLLSDAAALALGAALAAWLSTLTGAWDGLRYTPGARLEALLDDRVFLALFAGGIALVGGYLHFALRNLARRQLLDRIREESPDDEAGVLQGALRHNTPWWRTVFATTPRGWGTRARRRIEQVMSESNRYVRNLNDRFTNPSGVQPRIDIGDVDAVAETVPEDQHLPVDDQAAGKP